MGKDIRTTEQKRGRERVVCESCELVHDCRRAPGPPPPPAPVVPRVARTHGKTESSAQRIVVAARYINNSRNKTRC